MARTLARLVLPSSLLVRRSDDADELDLARRATDRAHLAVDRWQAATEMQRALHWEREWWQRHGQGHADDAPR